MLRKGHVGNPRLMDVVIEGAGRSPGRQPAVFRLSQQQYQRRRRFVRRLAPEQSVEQSQLDLLLGRFAKLGEIGPSGRYAERPGREQSQTDMLGSHGRILDDQALVFER